MQAYIPKKKKKNNNNINKKKKKTTYNHTKEKRENKNFFFFLVGLNFNRWDSMSKWTIRTIEKNPNNRPIEKENESSMNDVEL